MEITQIIIYSCITVFSLGMFLVSLLSYKKYRNQKLLFISTAFFLFLMKGILLSLPLFIDGIKGMYPDAYREVFDLAILILLFAATLKR